MSENTITITQPSSHTTSFVSPKISEDHWLLFAVLYIRQSTSHQLREHQESTARQYALKDRLIALGWPEERVIVIDDDLGITGTGKADRPGFRRLLKLVADQQVGIVLGLEMSRLARNSKDWHDLFEVCAIFHTLIADEDGVFDPHDVNDRPLEQEWEAALLELEEATSQLDQFRNSQPIQLSDSERDTLQHACADIRALWLEQATIEQRKQIVRLLIRRVEVEVHNNTDRVSVRLHWSGGFESCHDLTRTVMRFDQLEVYDQLLDRALELTLSGERSPKIASTLAAEGYRAPRSNTPISASMVMKLLNANSRSRQQLHDPSLKPEHWRSSELAAKLGIPEKQLKHWVTRGWATAIQRPFGRVWIIYADDEELQRLQQLASGQTGQGSPSPPETLRTPTPIPRRNR